MNDETQRLEAINSFYAHGDYMDELSTDRQIELIQQYPRFGNPWNTKIALEVGCGNGYSTEKLCKIFPDYEVIEASRQNIKLLKQRVSGLVIHHTLLEDFVPKHQYDYIFFLNIIEHVLDPIACLKILAGLIKDGGLIFISSPNCMSLNRRAGMRMGTLDSYETLAPKDHLVGHRRLYTVELLRDHCEQAGLKVMGMKGIYLKPLSEKQMVELGDEVIKAFHGLGEEIPEYCATIMAVATRK